MDTTTRKIAARLEDFKVTSRALLDACDRVELPAGWAFLDIAWIDSDQVKGALRAPDGWEASFAIPVKEILDEADLIERVREEAARLVARTGSSVG